MFWNLIYYIYCFSTLYYYYLIVYKVQKNLKKLKPICILPLAQITKIKKNAPKYKDLKLMKVYYFF